MMYEDRNSPAYCKLRFTDSRCGARWQKHEELHCLTCHTTWVDVESHDAHRNDGVCKRPGEVGMVLQGGRVYAAWGKPSPDELPLMWR